MIKSLIKYRFYIHLVPCCCRSVHKVVFQEGTLYYTVSQCITVCRTIIVKWFVWRSPEPNPQMEDDHVKIYMLMSVALLKCLRSGNVKGLFIDRPIDFF